MTFQDHRSKGKNNITICDGPRKPDPNTKKDCNPSTAIPDNETLTTFNESRHSALLQTAYSEIFNNELFLNNSAHIMFDSVSQKSYIIVDLKSNYI